MVGSSEGYDAEGRGLALFSFRFLLKYQRDSRRYCGNGLFVIVILRYLYGDLFFSDCLKHKIESGEQGDPADHKYRFLRKRGGVFKHKHIVTSCGGRAGLAVCREAYEARKRCADEARMVSGYRRSLRRERRHSAKRIFHANQARASRGLR